MVMTTTCPRCGGAEGAHFAGCVLQNLLQRWLGPEYPLWPPAAAVETADWDARDNVADLRLQIQAIRKDLDAAMEVITHPAPEPASKDPLSDESALSTFEGEFVDSEVLEPDASPPVVPAGPVSRSEHTKRINDDIRERARPTVERVIAEQMVEDPKGWVNGQDVYEAARKIDPDITQRAVGMILTESHEKQQRPIADGSKPAHYRGLAWKPEPTVKEQMEKRRQAEIAANLTSPPPKPKAKERYRYDGPRPGQEISAEYRGLLEPLWEIPGWSYAPSNPNGGGKPRVTTPAGTSYVIPNTPSDFRAIKNTRAALRRLGAPL